MDIETELLAELEASQEALDRDQCGYGTEPVANSQLKGSHGKTAYAIRINLEKMVEEDGIDSIGFLTLTVGDLCPVYGFRQVFSSQEANRRFNSLNSNLLKTLFKRAVVVTERHKSGAIHFHVVGALRSKLNIKSGFDWERVKKRDYRSVCPDLLEIWRMLRERLPEYGFGRAELTPIRKTGAHIASYLSKYVSKNLEARRPEDKGSRLVRYIGWNREQLKASEFGWASVPARQWRAKARQAAALVGCYTPRDCYERFGPKWAWILTESWTRICGKCPGWELDFSEGRREVLWEVLMKWADLKTLPERRRVIDRETLADHRGFFTQREGAGCRVWEGGCRGSRDLEMGGKWADLMENPRPSLAWEGGGASPWVPRGWGG